MSDVHHYPDEADWEPLERLCELLRRDSIILEPGEFMHMCEATRPDGLVLQLYKHIDTRRYLNLDANGHAYAYRHRERGTRYDLHDNILDAVADALNGPRPIISQLVRRNTAPSPPTWEAPDAA